MKNVGRPNAILIELVIVTLFFALASGVILQLYVVAHDRGVRSELSNAATMLAEDFSNRYAVSDLTAEEFLAADGWSLAGDVYTREEPVGKRTLRLEAWGGVRAMPVGTLEEWTLAVYDGEREVISLPVARYVPGEGL